MAFYSASRLSIELKRKQGTLTGRILGKFIDNSPVFLGTFIIWYTIALTIFVLQTILVLDPLIMQTGLSRLTQLALETIFTVFLVLVFVEFIPRAFFRANANYILNRLSVVINFFYSLLAPITKGFFKLSNWILKYVFNVRVDISNVNFARNGLRFMFQDDMKDMKAETSTTQLLENAQELPNIRIRHSLVPRKEIICVEVKTTIEALVEKFAETKRSRIIIYEDNIDNILGYVHELDMFKKPADIQSVMIPIPAVPESMSAVDLINKFSKEAKSIAWVVDEFGGTAGIITMEDVLEEIFGEIWDEYDTESYVEKQISEDEYIFSGRLELDYLERKYGLEFEGYDSETISGYVINHHETIPSQKERIIIGDYEFDVLSVSDTRIEMIKLKKLK